MPKCAQGMKWSKKLGRCVDPAKFNPKTGQRKGSGGGGGVGAYEVDETAEGENIFIGVPNDYRATGQGRWKPVRRGGPTWGNRLGSPRGIPVHTEKPIYKIGGEYRQLAGYSPDAIFQIQVDLVNLGYLEEEGWAPGDNDPKTAAAFKKVLAVANTQGRTWQDVLPEMLSNVEAAGGLGGPGEGEEDLPLQVQLTDPTTLGAAGSAVAGGPDAEGIGAIGRGMSDAEKMAFAADYQNQERMIQTDAYNRGLDPGEFISGSETGPPPAGVAAEEWLKKHRKGEVIGTNAAKAAAVWEDMLANSNWRLSSG